MWALLLLTNCSEKARPEAEAGRLDLTGWDFAPNGMVPLDGEWEFYWKELLGPTDFRAAPRPEKSGYFQTPAHWNGHDVGSENLGSDGYATFRLVLTLPPTARDKSIWISRIHSAARLFVNGELRHSSGVVGTDRASETPEFRGSLVDIDSQLEELELILQVSNHHLTVGGPSKSFTLGLGDAVRESRIHQIVSISLMLGVLLIMGIYHFFLFAMRRKDTSPLYLGLFCLFYGTYSTLFSGYALFVLPEEQYELVVRLSLASACPSMAAFATFCAVLYPLEAPKTVLRTVQFLGLGLGVLFLFLPAKTVFGSMWIIDILAIGAIAFSVSVLVRALIKQRESASILGFGSLVAAVCIVVSLLGYVAYYFAAAGVAFAVYLLLKSIFKKRARAISIGISTLVAAACVIVILVANFKAIPNIGLPEFGMVFIVLCQSIVLSRRFSKALWVAEETAGKLEEKVHLEREVAERKRSEAIAHERADYEARDKLRYQLGPHFLFNTLNSVRRMIRKDAEHAREMVSKLAELSRLTLARRSVEFVTLCKEIEMIRLYLELEQERYRDYLFVSIEIDNEAEAAEIPCFVLQPLVENALKYGMVTSPESLQVAITAEVEGGNLHVRVANTGHWVTDEERGAVPSTGFGLENVRKRLQGHYADAFRFDTNERDGKVCVEVVIPVKGES